MQEVMTDPVCTIDGHCYEKKAILTWFEKRITSPLTGTVLGSRTLIPNHALRRAIHEWRHIYADEQEAGRHCSQVTDRSATERKSEDDNTWDGEGRSQGGDENSGESKCEGTGRHAGRYERAVLRRSAQLERDLAEMRLVDDATISNGGDDSSAGGAALAQ